MPFQGTTLSKSFLSPSEKGSFQLGKSLLPPSLIELTPFQKGIDMQEGKQEVIKVVYHSGNVEKAADCIQLP